MSRASQPEVNFHRSFPLRRSISSRKKFIACKRGKRSSTNDRFLRQKRYLEMFCFSKNKERWMEKLDEFELELFMNNVPKMFEKIKWILLFIQLWTFQSLLIMNVKAEKGRHWIQTQTILTVESPEDFLAVQKSYCWKVKLITSDEVKRRLAERFGLG